MKLHETSLLGRRCYGFNIYRDLVDVDFPAGSFPVQDAVEDTDMKQSLFSVIFSVDPLTKLPSTDIANYLASSTRPEVKLFIEQNLMKPFSVQSDGSGQFSGLSDDDIAEFTRGASESVSAYRDRITNALLSERARSLSNSSKSE